MLTVLAILTVVLLANAYDYHNEPWWVRYVGTTASIVAFVGLIKWTFWLWFHIWDKGGFVLLYSWL